MKTLIIGFGIVTSFISALLGFVYVVHALTQIPFEIVWGITPLVIAFFTICFGAGVAFRER